MNNRRDFIRAAALTALSHRRIQGANDRVRVGAIGMGTRGPQLLGFAQKYADIVALSDAYSPCIGAVDRIVTLRDGRPMATSIRLPRDIMEKYVFPDKPDLKVGQMMRFPTQVRNTCEEIRQGRPWGIIADGE